MTDYWDLPQLEGLYLEDSFVLEIREAEHSVTLSMDFVLRETHRTYGSPKAGEQYCYRRGLLCFGGASDVELAWNPGARSTDATGEVDYGGIDAFRVEGSRAFLEGPWGTLKLNFSDLSVQL